MFCESPDRSRQTIAHGPTGILTSHATVRGHQGPLETYVFRIAGVAQIRPCPCARWGAASSPLVAGAGPSS